MGLLNVSTRALLADQVVLQTTGHNIANVNTPGYSRQSVALQTVPGQFTGNGYIGQGVDVAGIVRSQSELLTRQSAAAGAAQSADAVRAERLGQLQDVFSGGSAGLGAAINDMLNAFADVLGAPTDITARTVVLTRIDETAARMRTAAGRMDEIQSAASAQLQSSVGVVNDLAMQMAAVNEQITRAKGNGQTPNDLLDRRDQIIRDINQQLQTTQIPADDGSVGLFVAGSQPLVLGNTATSLSIAEASAFPGSGQARLFFNRPGAKPVEMDDSLLGGGAIPGLLRFDNHDLSEGRNLLGRMAMGLGLALNQQQNQGLTLDGQPGKNLFGLPASMPGHTSGAGVGTVTFSDPTRFAASDYEIRFATGSAGQVVRLSDGQATPFTDPAQLAAQAIDGLRFDLTRPGAPGQSMLFKPFGTAASNLQALVHAPRDLAAANPVMAAMGSANGGTLQLAGLKATGLPHPPGLVLPANANPAATPPIAGGVQLQFDAGPPMRYDVLDRRTTPPTTVATAQPYVSGAPIAIDGWEIRLQGAPNTGDTVLIGNALDPQYGDRFSRDTGNASALMDLRDLKMFDESTLSDGYAQAIAQVGTRTQSAKFAADLSRTIAANLERDRTAISGVNLDEEAARLIQYQQAFQASSKVMQVAQNIFDALLQGLAR
ncbi:flagellar hook-associated protein FlgK [Verminephrobacter eiseniae]|uniref:flagellar hook-associated protein FlgK n=1 Tax=Verminephrobacter eiseniae TaxID=364317 RepID=UPI00223904AF|nr:flagellar hook-associated protein FlgK [Verminephrobacter eiseniae]MCW5286707.1 flagellar hook-associated protein FlgK [Verminephrobacter eiseniae]MCW5305004.1 flagellar hook-associated protein FlgK [Verminephrobacter eiseniae]MCW8182043.1 flagellar hook-associated protein FlgK [Verminephrobacter eiseniae]MCW8192548.1 flagellar hook-associated protein FlgK [Verminephrobacter eiseniae]